jgi:hypothetical protein
MHVATLEVPGVRGFHRARSVELDFQRPDGSFAGWTVLAGRKESQLCCRHSTRALRTSRHQFYPKSCRLDN